MNARSAGAADRGPGHDRASAGFRPQPRAGWPRSAVRLAAADAGLALADLDGLLDLPRHHRRAGYRPGTRARPARPAPARQVNIFGASAARPSAGRRAGGDQRHGHGGRLRVRRHAAARGGARRRAFGSHGASARTRRPGWPGSPGLRRAYRVPQRRRSHTRWRRGGTWSGTAPPASSLRRSRCRSGSGRPATRWRGSRRADQPWPTTSVPLGGRAAAPARLLPGLQRRDRGGRDHGASGRRGSAARRCTSGAGGRAIPGTGWPGAASSAWSPGGGSRAGPRWAWPAIGPADVTMCQIYDCYTYTVLVSLEDYGFCAKGEGGAFAASGALAPGGSLPVNTGGGQLSGYYMWGFTPLSEAVIQARGDGGERQSTRNRHHPGQRERRHPGPSRHPGPQPSSPHLNRKDVPLWTWATSAGMSAAPRSSTPRRAERC